MLRKRVLLVSGFAAALLLSTSPAWAGKYDVWVADYNVQALLGATHFDHFKFRVDDSATSEEVDMSTIPQLGGAWTTLPVGDRFQCGLESSFLLGFQIDDINYLQFGGGGLRVSLSSSLWMFDLAGGAYANLYLDPDRNVRIYAAGGPLMMYASYRAEREYSDDTEEEFRESEFGLGVYARSGIEFRIQDAGMLGLGVRGTWADLDFSNVGGESDLTSLGIFATFTAGF